ncbi:MAG: peptidyl-prolyl cis-trans isomerase, partial [Desulfamplus sp.]|nr:peptidyl-prolyl cis-trans isomerase [Desulfamplus sp.]
LKDDGLSFLEYREKIREEILRPKLINYTIKSKVVITDKDIKDYYEKNNQTFSGKRRYFLRNILKKDRDSVDLIKKRLDDGEDFKAVAAAASEAPNADEEGELGFFDWDTLSDTIKDAIENLKSGDHTEVISTDQGYQIFYVETIDDNQNLAPLDAEVSEAISKKLYDEIVEKKFREWLDDLKKKSHIKLML